MKERGTESAWPPYKTERNHNAVKDEEYDIKNEEYAANSIQSGKSERHFYILARTI